MVTVAVLVTAGALLWQGTHTTIALYHSAVAIDHQGQRHAVPVGVGADWIAGTRVVLPGEPMPDPEQDAAGAVAVQQATMDLAWLRAGTVPGAGTEYEDMTRTMLLDLHTLTNDNGAVLAGWSQRWRYVWPRDAAFVSVAYARTGHTQDALDALLFIQQMQAPDGALAARYLPDGTGVPDARGPQEDGQGWMLWATVQLLHAVGDDTARRDVAEQLQPLIELSTGRLLDRIDPDTGLPRPSSDYWERHEEELTLGIAATSLIGLESAATLVRRDWNDDFDLQTLELAAGRLRDRIEATFGAQGYPRTLGTGPDAAVTFLLPPLLQCPAEGAQRARLASIPGSRREGGGVSPGTTWRDDGISWTPETALQALAAAHTGRTGEARRWLNWLHQHRTTHGAVPEKVLWNGDPAAVAPLAWTAALIVLTVDALDDPLRSPRC